METLIATGIASTIFAVIATAFVFSSRSFVSLANYVDLDQRSRNTLDRMSQQIRRVRWLSDYSTNYLTFEDIDGSVLKFTYNSDERTLRRTQAGVPDTKPLLTECDYFQFSIFQRNPINGTYDQYPTATATNCKLVQVTWICSRKILGTKFNTESVQSAKIVIRRR